MKRSLVSSESLFAGCRRRCRCCCCCCNSDRSAERMWPLLSKTTMTCAVFVMCLLANMKIACARELQNEIQFKKKAGRCTALETSQSSALSAVSVQLLLLLSVTLDSYTQENTSFSRVHKYLFVSLHRRHRHRQLCIVGVRLSIDESHTSMLPPPSPPPPPPWARLFTA